MFDGMHHQDQLFRKFISSSSSSPPPSSPSSSRPPPPPSSLHHQHHLQQISSPFPNFDNSTSFPTPSPPHNHQSIQFHDLFHRPNLPSSFPHLNQAPSLSQHHLIIPKQYNDHHQSHINTALAVEVHHQKDLGHFRSLLPPPPSCTTTAANLVVERKRLPSSSSTLPHHHQSLHQADDIWSNEEVVALLRIRSSSESSWFPPDFTWEHVSRKLAENGFKRSAEKCKEKFEEESRTYFNTAFNIDTYNNSSVSGNKINCNDSNTYKVLGELEGFCTGDENIENNAANADNHEEDAINNNQQDMEVDEALGCEKHKILYISVASEGVRAPGEINEDASYPSPIDHSQPDQPAEPRQQSDHPKPMEVRERQPIKAMAKKRIRKGNKEQKFKIMEGLCEGFVHKMMNQQEELHNKILNDMLKRDEENVAREEAWKRMEMERLNTEIEMRVQEQAIAGDRQAAIIEFLNKFSSTTTTTSASSSSQNQNQCIIDENIVADLLKVLPKPISHISYQIFDRSQNHNNQSTPQNLLHETLEPQTPTSTIQPNLPITKLPPALPIPNTTTPGDTTTSTAILEFNHKPSSKKELVSQGRNPNSSSMGTSSNNSRAVSTPEDYGKRWPRDEVLALINLRCSFMTNNSSGDDDNTRDANGSKAPLWERISQKMSELGYKRSAKRCKEKWENINKYFRKTKDNVNKKRSLDSRTCPYFHQLSHLYNQGTLIAPTNESENQSNVPENQVPDTLEAVTTTGGDGDHAVEV